MSTIHERTLARAATQTVGIDGIRRAKADEERLNILVGDALNSPAGEALLAYLTKLTLHRVATPPLDPHTLAFNEGARWVTSILKLRFQAAEHRGE